METGLGFSGSRGSSVCRSRRRITWSAIVCTSCGLCAEAAVPRMTRMTKASSGRRIANGKRATDNEQRVAIVTRVVIRYSPMPLSMAGKHSLLAAHYSLFAVCLLVDTERLELAMERRALHAHELGGAGDVAPEAADLGDQVFALEHLARIAQRQAHQMLAAVAA